MGIGCVRGTRKVMGIDWVIPVTPASLASKGVVQTDSSFLVKGNLNLNVSVHGLKASSFYLKSSVPYIVIRLITEYLKRISLLYLFFSVQRFLSHTF